MTRTVESLQKAAQGFSVVLREFLLWTSRRSTSFICAFEGLDAQYYDSRVRSLITGIDTNHFHLRGRKNVLSLLRESLVSNAISRLKIAFFVDRDYREPEIADDRLYVTPGYSIENNYTSDAALRRAIMVAFDLREIISTTEGPIENPELLDVINFCTGCFNAFSDKLGKQLNSFLLAAFEAWCEAASGGVHYPVDTKSFDAARFRSLYAITDAGLQVFQEPTYERLLDWFSVSEAQVPRDKYIANLALEVDWRRLGRGKFEMDVLIRLFDTLAKDAAKSKPKIFSKKHTIKIGILGEAPLADFGSFADTPPCLRSFLNSMAAKYRIQ